MILDSGLHYMADLLASGMYLAIGTDGTPEAPGQTALVAEIAREAITIHPVADGVVEFQVYFTSAQVGGLTIREFGLFPGVSGVDGFDRTTQVVVVPEGSGMVVSWSVAASR